MDTAQLLQYLRDSSLEEGRASIQEHIAELTDSTAIGEALADEALRVLYTPFVSLKIAEQLIFYGDLVHSTSSHALGLKAKGDALVQIGHFQAAMECLDASGDEFLQLGDEGNWARSRISWVAACTWLGRVEEALAEAERSRAVFQRLNEYYWVCVIEHNMAWIYEQIGRDHDAIKLYENMRAIFPTLMDQSQSAIARSIALAEGNQAVVLVRLGNFAKAYQLLQQARAYSIALDEVDLVINIEKNLADLGYIQGYYGSALRSYYQAQDNMLQNDIDDPPLLAEIKLSVANCLVKLNRAQEACILANDAVELSRSTGISLNTGNALRDYAATLVASSRLQEALSILNEAWTLFNQSGFEPHAFATKLQQAELLLESGSAAAAYEQAHLASEYFQSRGLVARSVRANLVKASALIANLQQQTEPSSEEVQRLGSLQDALALCRQAALQARQYHLQEEVYKSHYLLGRLSLLEGNPTRAGRHFSAAIAQIERILNDLVYDLSPAFMHTIWPIYEDMISLCLQQSQFERAFDYLEQARSVALRQYLNRAQRSSEGVQESSFLASNNSAILRTRHDLKEEQEKLRDYTVLIASIDYSVSSTVNRKVIEGEIKRCEAKISELFERLNLYEASTPLPLHRSKRLQTKRPDSIQLRRSLKPDALLLAYYLHKDRLVVFMITAEKVRAYESPDGGAQLERLLPLLHAHLDPKGWSNVQKPPQHVVTRLLQKLYAVLLAPVAEFLPAEQGQVTVVPFGPLHKLPFHALHDGTKYLVERFQINYLPASSILTHIETQKNENSSRPPLVLGYSGNGDLRRVHDEARMVASLLHAEYYLEEEATIARLIEHASGASIIHVASHGQSRLDAPNFSYVRLADGQLNAIDAFSLDLRACELVTLSGCETGLALTGGGDEQLGLGRAFLAAGATSLVMSLWPVEDNATNALMQLFYQNLLRGDSKVQALRAAQSSLLHSEKSIYAHPYFWAAFRLVGDTGPLLKTQLEPFAVVKEPLKK
jgi:tetratricopeptide (TPR) repeat protein